MSQLHCSIADVKGKQEAHTPEVALVARVQEMKKSPAAKGTFPDLTCPCNQGILPPLPTSEELDFSKKVHEFSQASWVQRDHIHVLVSQVLPYI